MYNFDLFFCAFGFKRTDDGIPILMHLDTMMPRQGMDLDFQIAM